MPHFPYTSCLLWVALSCLALGTACDDSKSTEKDTHEAQEDLPEANDTLDSDVDPGDSEQDGIEVPDQVEDLAPDLTELPPGDPCDPNPCQDPHRSDCAAVDGLAQCRCDAGYHLYEDQCIPDDEDDPCFPNPCTETNRTRCLWDGEGGHECRCNVGFHDDNGLCCQAFADNVAGQCQCRAAYVDPDDSGVCVVRCSEDSIEAFNGWCPPGEICVQGTCFHNHCDGFTCPANSQCVNRAESAFCLCDQDYHMSNGLCCVDNAENIDGTCQCAPGYVASGQSCVPDATNPCHPVNPCTSLHRTTCVPDSGAPGYLCLCDQGYVESNGNCVLDVWATCPTGLVCRASFCVPHDLSQDQCVTDADCRVFNPLAPTICNASAAGGICLGCGTHSDCPGNTQCTSFQTCANLCDDNDDCPYGRCYTATGYCGQKTCTSDADCFNGTVCLDENGSGQGMCKRIPCVETECSSTRPNGTCPNPGEACVYGVCRDSCTPNPCTQELNKTQCSTANGAPACLCDSGYSLAADGRCLPDASPCPANFTCGAGVCAHRTDAHFVCQNHSDCGTGLTCSPTLPAGSCQGCGVGTPCPTGQTCVSGYCLTPCTNHLQCHPDMQCRGTGYCGRKPCNGAADCNAPYLCVQGSDGGTCQRPPC